MNIELLVAYVLWAPAMLASRISLTDLVPQQAYRTRNAMNWLASDRRTSH